MRNTKGTFCLGHETLRKLQGLSQQTGVSQSALVDIILSSGLIHLEKNWQSASQVLQKDFIQITTHGQQRAHRRRKLAAE
jgi:hypothetical protein